MSNMAQPKPSNFNVNNVASLTSTTPLAFLVLQHFNQRSKKILKAAADVYCSAPSPVQ